MKVWKKLVMMAALVVASSMAFAAVTCYVCYDKPGGGKVCSKMACPTN